MRLIELHILQSFPVSCLNRDDLGAPKTAVFGGVNRARISSQSLKRAIRMMLRELCPDLCQGERSKLIVDPLTKALEEELRQSQPLSEVFGRQLAQVAEFFSRQFCHKLAVLDEEAERDKGIKKVKTLVFLSPAERDRVAKTIRQELENMVSEASRDKKSQPPLSWLREFGITALSAAPPGDDEAGAVPAAAANDKPAASKKAGKKEKGGEREKEVGKILKKAIAAVKDANLADAGDIALFGRMVANDPTLNVEGAAMFSHALSTHRADNDIDFYTAVDDRQQEDPTVADEDRAGSGMMGTLEFTSATYYRYAAVNLDLLADSQHLAALAEADRKRLLDAFLRATLLAVPSARKNSMNAATLPSAVLGLYRDKGHPLQLVNAFEEPLLPDGSGYVSRSRKKLEDEFAKMKEIWGIQPQAEVWLPAPGGGMTLDEFCAELLKYV
jgi:CRISPR system Cascade subunit CasC